MKKLMAIIAAGGLFLVYLLSLAAFSAYANSAPIYREALGGGFVFSKESDVSVTNEVLDLSLSQSGMEVTATYTMKNETDSALISDAAFLYPTNIGYDVIPSISINSAPVAYTTDFFISDMYEYGIYSKPLDWEEILKTNTLRPDTFGVGTGFCEITFKPTLGASYVQVEFVSNQDIRFFVQNANLNYYNNKVVLVNSSYTDHITIIIDQTVLGENQTYAIEDYLTIQGVIAEKKSIPDIYDYLYNIGLESAIFDTRFTEQQFNRYLYDCQNVSDYRIYGYPLFYPTYIDSYISAACYTASFAPNETLTLSVTYTQPIRTGNTLYFSYYLSPAKNWHSFGGITINLQLNESYPILSYSSIDLQKIGMHRYSYDAPSLPSEELSLTIKKAGLFGTLSSGTVAICVIIIIIMSLTSIAILLKSRRS